MAAVDVLLPSGLATEPGSAARVAGGAAAAAGGLPPDVAARWAALAQGDASCGGESAGAQPVTLVIFADYDRATRFAALARAPGAAVQLLRLFSISGVQHVAVLLGSLSDSVTAVVAASAAPSSPPA